MRAPGSILILTAAIVGLLAVSATTASAEPPSWSSFWTATFEQIDVTPSFNGSSLTYTVSLGPNPKITVGAATYDVVWVAAFFAVGTNNGETFQATNGTLVTDWMWEYKDAQHGGPIAGWISQGDADRLYPLGNPSGHASSKVFDYGAFQVPAGGLDCGFHIGYLDGDVVNTAFYKNWVPEPSSLVGLASAAVGSLLALRRKIRRS